MGGRSGGSRDATMRQLIASTLPRAYAGARQGQALYARASAQPLPRCRTAAHQQPRQCSPLPRSPRLPWLTRRQRGDRATDAPASDGEIRPAVVADAPRPKASGTRGPQSAWLALVPGSDRRRARPARSRSPFCVVSTPDAGRVLRWSRVRAGDDGSCHAAGRTSQSAMSDLMTASVQVVRTTTFKVATVPATEPGAGRGRAGRSLPRQRRRVRPGKASSDAARSGPGSSRSAPPTTRPRPGRLLEVRVDRRPRARCCGALHRDRRGATAPLCGVRVRGPRTDQRHAEAGLHRSKSRRSPAWRRRPLSPPNDVACRVEHRLRLRRRRSRFVEIGRQTRRAPGWGDEFLHEDTVRAANVFRPVPASI